VAGASVEQIAQTINAANSSLSPDLAEVLKMAEAGVDEKTILTYIENSPGFRLKADDVIFLHKQGVSPTIVTALLQHPAKAQIAQAQAAPPAQQQVANAPVYATAPTQPVYVQSPSVVYSDPYYYGYPGYGYGYPYGYYGYGYPSVGIGIGFGIPFGFHNGFHGGFHGSGGGLHVHTGGAVHSGSAVHVAGGGGLHAVHR
jgi:hypothetical protein